ncbi:unnamed protein product [Ectocarpus fasciculatus]
MQAALKKLQTMLEEGANVREAIDMKRYLRYQFEFLGLKSPLRRTIHKKFREGGVLELSTEEKLIAWVELLWRQPYREYQYIAMDDLASSRLLLTMKGAQVVERLITTSSWWDTVDILASNILGEFYKTRPTELADKMLNEWRLSSDIWLNRTAIIVQLKYKTVIDLRLLKAAIQPHIESTEFFHQKAIGWALREVTKTNPDWVKNYLKNNSLQPLSDREAMRWLRRNK